MLHFTFPPHETALFNHLFTNPVETDKALRDANITVDHFTTRASKGLFHNLWPHLYRCTLPGAHRQHDRHRALLELRGRVHRQLTDDDIDRLNAPASMPLGVVIAALRQPRVPALPLPLGFIIADQAPVSAPQPALDQSAPSPLPAPQSAPVLERAQPQPPPQPIAPPRPAPQLRVQAHPSNMSYLSHPSHQSNSSTLVAPPRTAPVSEDAPAQHATAAKPLTPPPHLRLQPHSRSFASISGQNSQIHTETPPATRPLAPTLGCEPPLASFPPRAQKPETRNPFSSKKKPRPDDVLGNLPEADQELILGWVQKIGLRGTVDQIAKPRPEGLALAIQFTSLRRFYEKCRRIDFQLDFKELDLATPFSRETFALICRSIEAEIVVGLDRPEDRKETIRLLSVYARLFALHQKKAGRGSRRDFFVTQPGWPQNASDISDPFSPAFPNPQSDDAQPAPLEPVGITADLDPPKPDPTEPAQEDEASPTSTSVPPPAAAAPDCESAPESSVASATAHQEPALLDPALPNPASSALKLIPKTLEPKPSTFEHNFLANEHDLRPLPSNPISNRVLSGPREQIRGVEHPIGDS